MNKKLFLSLFLLVLCWFTQINAFSQESKDNLQTADWIQLKSNNAEFSIEMPSNYVYFFDKDGFSFSDTTKTYEFKEVQMLHASIEKTVMNVEIHKVSSPKNYLSKLLDKQTYKGSKTELSQEGFIVKQFEQKKFSNYTNKKDIEISHITRFIASKTHLYIITAANRGAKTQAFEHFFSSIRLNSSQPMPSNTSAVNISSLKPITIQDIGEAVEENKTNPPPVTQQLQRIENPTPLLILTRPFAGYTAAARNSTTTGVVRLRATFSKDGRISKIGIISNLPNGLTRNAFFAALQMKFIPQEKDNELVTVTKTVEYSFSIY